MAIFPGFQFLLSQFFLKQLILYYIIILSKKKLGSLAIFYHIFFWGVPIRFRTPLGGKLNFCWDQIFFMWFPYIVRKSHKNVYSFDRSFFNGNIFKNQWVVSAPPPVSDRVKFIFMSLKSTIITSFWKKLCQPVTRVPKSWSPGHPGYPGTFFKSLKLMNIL